MFVVAAAGIAAAPLSPDVQQRIFDGAAERRAASIHKAPLADDAATTSVVPDFPPS
jgi:hypothetical protein